MIQVIADIIIVAVIAGIFFLCIRKLYKDKKTGTSGCGGNCSGCHQCDCGKSAK